MNIDLSDSKASQDQYFVKSNGTRLFGQFVVIIFLVLALKWLLSWRLAFISSVSVTVKMEEQEPLLWGSSPLWTTLTMSHKVEMKVFMRQERCVQCPPLLCGLLCC